MSRAVQMSDQQILIVPPDVDIEALAQAVDTGGPLPAGAYYMSFDEWTAIGRIEDCDCGLLQCRCLDIRGHARDCTHRLSIQSPVVLLCNHGHAECHECYACNCGFDLSTDFL